MSGHVSNRLHTTRSAAALVAVCLVLIVCGPATARTIVLTDEVCEEMAVISSLAPRMSWAGVSLGAGQFGTYQIYLTVQSSVLIRYPLESIPTGQRITKAEWIVPHSSVYPATGTRLSVYRVLQPWGAGVSHELRMIRPAQAKWHTPGARGVGQDRAARATASVLSKGTGDDVFNVTTDVELWYTGAARNYGWIIAVDDPGATIMLQSPFWTAPKGWKLRITFEPQ